MKRALIALAAFVVVMLPLGVYAASPTFVGPIVQECALGGPYCQLCDLVHLANRAINFAVYLSILIATAMFVYAGVLYVTYSTNQGGLEKAKKIFSTVAIGLVIVLASWLIINVILSVLTGKGLDIWSQDTGVCTAAANAPAPLNKIYTTDPSAAAQSDVNNQIALQQCGVGVKQTNTQVGGTAPATIDYLCTLQETCRSVKTPTYPDITVTGGSETTGGHTGSGPGTHVGGDKVDLGASSGLKACVANMETAGVLKKIPTPSFGGPGAKQWVDAQGRVWTLEDVGTPNEHYDVCSQNCKAPATTGP